MGLNGRKLKQRIGNDPRNLSWADDAARFGINYLSKFGWDSSKGLGASGEGRKSHLEVSKKLDMLGIGAAHQLDPSGIAWKQNKDFENLLKRLNGDVVEDVGLRKADDRKMDGFEQAKVDIQDDGKKERKRERKALGKEAPRKKKRKFIKDAEDEDEQPGVNESINLPSERETATSGSSERRRKVPTLPRHRAHRARAIAAKNLSSKSAVHISEILGISPTSSTTATSSGSNTLEIGTITTSTKSLHDYFKDKLKTKKLSTFVNPSVGSVDHTERDVSHDTPRGGLGSSSRTSSTLSSTFLTTAKQSLPSDASSHTEIAVDTGVAEESAATLNTEKKVKKKRNDLMDEDKCVTRKSEAFVSDDDSSGSREKKEGETADFGECHSKPYMDREGPNKKRIADREVPSPNLITKKKKADKAKHIRD